MKNLKEGIEDLQVDYRGRIHKGVILTMINERVAELLKDICSVCYVKRYDGCKRTMRKCPIKELIRKKFGVGEKPMDTHIPEKAVKGLISAIRDFKNGKYTVTSSVSSQKPKCPKCGSEMWSYRKKDVTNATTYVCDKCKKEFYYYYEWYECTKTTYKNSYATGRKK